MGKDPLAPRCWHQSYLPSFGSDSELVFTLQFFIKLTFYYKKLNHLGINGMHDDFDI